MYLTIFDQVDQAELQTLEVAPQSLYRAFEQVADGRKAKGKRYPLPLLLTLLLLGKLAGETKVIGIIDWLRERQSTIRAQLDWPKRFPVQSTYSEALAHCDAEQIARVIAQVLLKARAVKECGSEPSRLQANKQHETLTHVALDGKTLRGTLKHRSEGQPSVHLLGLYDCQSGIVLAQRAVASKENAHQCRRLAPSGLGERTHHQHRCLAYAKEVVYRRPLLHRLLPVHCQREPTHSVRGYPRFL